jgi:hypothetical protein
MAQDQAMKFVSRFFASVATIAVCSGNANAQSPPFRELPAPTIAPAPFVVAVPNATITLADGTQITTQAGSTGRFQLVGLHPREVINIALEFPATSPGNSVTAQPLDGGRILGAPKLENGAGGGLIRFQVGDLPGLYRVFAAGGSSRSLFQFWVANPKNPKANPRVLNPGH